jgi:hypothetical protein
MLSSNNNSYIDALDTTVHEYPKVKRTKRKSELDHIKILSPNEIIRASELESTILANLFTGKFLLVGTF